MSLLEEGFSSWEKKGKNVDLCNFLRALHASEVLVCCTHCSRQPLSQLWAAGVHILSVEGVLQNKEE